MDRRTGDDRSGDPLLRAALRLFTRRILGELPSDEELSARYENTSRLDGMIKSLFHPGGGQRQKG